MSMDDRTNRWFDPALIQHLPSGKCHELLAAKSVGRVGFNGPEGPQVLPVNYVLHQSDIFFRTAVDSAISRAMPASRVAFEVDDIDEFMQRGWSILAVGGAALVVDPDLLVKLWGDRGPKPWAAGTRPLIIRIRTSRLTGRRVLSR